MSPAQKKEGRGFCFFGPRGEPGGEPVDGKPQKHGQRREDRHGGEDGGGLHARVRLHHHEAEAGRGTGHGVLLATTLAFFLAEMGDKTQVATVVLAAQYAPLWQVVVGTTAGMLLANVPVVWLGARFADRLPLRAARIAAALLFAGLGAWILLRG